MRDRTSLNAADPATGAQEATHTRETPVPSDEVFIVDDDPMVTDLLVMVLTSEGYRVTSFNDGESFDAIARQRTPACVILDVCMPGRSGLDILKDIDAPNYPAPIIIMSGKASIPMAVEAVKNGAFDIVEKPFTPEAIVARIREATDAWTRSRTNGHVLDLLSLELPGGQRLTPREAEVLAEITAAATNKEAGLRLGISPRTVEVHRARLMMKFRAKNAADLVRIALTKRHH